VVVIVILKRPEKCSICLDPDSTLLDVNGGGQAHQLFNVGLKLARNFCPNLTKLSLFGCGLVSNQLINRLSAMPELIFFKSPFWQGWQIFLDATYQNGKCILNDH
jgi:hypothetical protein